MPPQSLFQTPTIDFRVERVNRGKSVRAMAEEVGVTEHVWRHLERGGVPRATARLAIATYFNATVTEVWPINNVPE